MIPEYLKLQEDINERAVHVGRIIQNAKHFAVQGMPFPAVSPFIGFIGEEYVGIVVGKTHDGAPIRVMFPIGLFETANDADIRIWVFSQNHQYTISRQNTDDADAAAKRIKELATLAELVAKYPEEVTHA